MLYDPDALTAAEAVAAHFAPADLPAVFAAAARHGLAATHGGRSLRAWAGELAGIARDGLRRQAERANHPDERPFLVPVFAVLDRGESPGMALVAAGPHTPAAVLPRLGC